MKRIRRVAAYVLLIGIYGFTWLVAVLGGIIPRRSWKPNGRIIVTGTFHNPGWYISHILPMSLSGVKEVILVVDEPQLPLERVRFVCPPKWISKLLTRAGAKAIWMIIAGIRYRPDLYMGYHIVPGACSALVAGSLLGRPTCYQMTGGPVEIIGGGFKSQNIGRYLCSPSRFIEAVALNVIELFDLIVVRGNKAKDFFISHDANLPVTIITGSVRSDKVIYNKHRDIDLVFVGRLSPDKQVGQFINIIKAVSLAIPSIKASIVGDGPMIDDIKAMVDRLELTDNIKLFGKRRDVYSILCRSKVFVLTSKSEGLSIAMAEAMACGVVPVVANVGELSDLVTDGVNGYLIKPNCIDEYAEKVISILQDQALWEKYSKKAIKAVENYCEVNIVTRKWQQCIREIIAQRAGVRVEEVLNCTTC